MNDTDFVSAAGGYEYTPPVAVGVPQEYLDSMYPDIPNDTHEFISYEYKPEWILEIQ